MKSFLLDVFNLTMGVVNIHYALKADQWFCIINAIVGVLALAVTLWNIKRHY
jgi:hypothetical protein